MTMPRFAAGDDPGASFPDLLRKLGIDPFPSMSGAVVEANLRGGGSDNAIPHATTCLALTYDRGVV
ncbi:MAG: proteasome subunit beta, partial [Actinobacteria bacterium]|nr:proteasome subunit beta [Actinomycetota bacterium]NDF68393.1 proteasome subunit beta [Actinomycetota bacterium]NDG11466.1 proteasome subunit beta [Actinomycetota bacterium]